MSSLTSGALPALHFGASPHEIGSPIWQVLELKPTNNNQFARCVVSDGDYYYQAMFPSQQSALVKEGKVINGSIIQVTEFTFQDIKGKRLIFLLQLEVLQLQCERIGNPQSIDQCTLDREKCLAAFNSAALSSSGTAMAVESKAPLLMPIDNQNTFSSSPQQHHQQSLSSFNQSGGGNNGGFHSSFNRPSNNSFASSSSFQSSAPSYMRTDNNNNNNNLSHRTPSNSTTTSSISAGNYSGYYSHQPIPSDSEIYPISSLTPFQTKWTLKVRIQLKSDLKTYNQPKTGGQGKLYNMDLIDRYGESIRCTAFGTTAEKLYPMFEQGHTYIISNAKHNHMTGERESSKSSVRLANAKFKKGKNDYEIFLGNDLEVWHIIDDHSIEGQKFYFKELASIQNIHLNNNNNNNNGINSSQGQHYNNNAPSSSFVRSDDTMDVAGVVVQVGPLQEFTSKNDKHLKKRVIQIVDSSRAKVEVTLWGDDAEKKYTEETLNNYPIIAIKNARLTEFQNAKSLSVSFQSQIQLNPTIPAIIQLKQWWDNDGKLSYDSFDNLSKRDSSLINNIGGGEKKLNERKYLSDIIDLGRGDKPDYFTSRVVLSFIKHSNDKLPWYFACPNKKPNNNNNNNKGENKCGKKVTQPDAGDYFCDSCSLPFARPDVRYIVSIVALDATGSQWFTAFDDAAKVLIGKSAAELQDLINNQDIDTVLRIFQESLFKRYIFRASASIDNNQQGGDGIQRIRYRVMEAKPFNYVEESKLLMDDINKYEQILGIN